MASVNLLGVFAMHIYIYIYEFIVYQEIDPTKTIINYSSFIKHINATMHGLCL